MARIGVCVLGAGDMGRTHARSWSQVEGAELIAVADPDEARARKSCEDHGFDRWFTDWREALEQPGIQAVSICVPSGYHCECSTAAMGHGYHVLCEKPLAVCEEDALAMVQTAERTGVLLGVAFCKRFSNAIHKVRDIVAGGGIERPVMYRFATGWEIRFKPWIMDRRLGGGPIIDLACHYFDQWRFIFESEPVRVKASGMTFSIGAPELLGVEPEMDTATILVEHDSGDVGVISVSWGLPRGTRSGSLEDVLGPAGVISLEGLDKLTLVRSGGEEVFEGLGNDMYLDQTRAFARAVTEGAPLSTAGADGLTALRVSLAAIESARSGVAVELEGQG